MRGQEKVEALCENPLSIAFLKEMLFYVDCSVIYQLCNLGLCM